MTNQKNFSVFIRSLSHIFEIASNRTKELRNEFKGVNEMTKEWKRTVFLNREEVIRTLQN